MHEAIGDGEMNFDEGRPSACFWHYSLYGPGYRCVEDSKWEHMDDTVCGTTHSHDCIVG